MTQALIKMGKNNLTFNFICDESRFHYGLVLGKSKGFRHRAGYAVTETRSIDLLTFFHMFNII